MDDPGYSIFQSLDTYGKLQDLIDNGEAEGPHLECKSPGAPQLGRDMKAQLAEAASGFSNTGGGVIIWGISTTRHAHSNLDVLTQIEPIGSPKKLAQQVDLAIRTTTYQSVQAPSSRILHRAKGDTRGVVLSYIPPTPGDPVQSLIDRRFYLRNGDEFVEMPYEILKKMFAGAAGPDLVPIFDSRLVAVDAEGKWKIPIILENRSSAAAEDTDVSVEIVNPEACEQSQAEGLRDSTAINPGARVYIAKLVRHEKQALKPAPIQDFGAV